MSLSPSSEEATKVKVSVTAEIRAAEQSDAQEIAEELVQDVTKISKGVITYLSGFRTFILRGNLIDLAIGIVIGAAFTSVVNSLVGDIITPLIPVYQGSLATAKWKIPWATDAYLNYGHFINAVISFLIVAAVLYFFVVQPVNTLMKIYKPEPVKPETRECPHCYQSVHHKATRCPYCTSHLNEDTTHHKAEEDDPTLNLPPELEKLSEKLAKSIVGGSAATTAAEVSPKE